MGQYNDCAFNAEEAALFIDKGADYYIRKWSTAKDPNTSSGINWWAAVTGVFWLGYRKMYSLVLLLLAVLLVIEVICLLCFGQTYKQINIGITLAFAFTANTVYFKFMNRQIAKVKTKEPDPKKQKTLIAEAGGTSWLGIVIVFMTLFIYTRIVEYFRLLITSGIN